VDRYGEIFHSSDGGETWSIQNIEVSVPLNAVWFSNTEDGWAVGENGIIIHTSDAGASWETQNPIAYSDDLQSVSVIDGDYVWVAGHGYDQGAYASTQDGGQAWSFSSSDDLKYNCISFQNDMLGWLTGTNDDTDEGFIYKTTNGGQNWDEIMSDTYSTNSIFFIDELIGWIAADYLLLHTTDGGNYWEHQLTGTGGVINSLYFLDENNGWIAGSGSKLLSTQDGGNSWEDHSFDFYQDLNDVFFTDPNHGWVVGEYGLFTTSDAAITWEHSYKGYQINSICFADMYHGWIVARGGLILHTSDGGINWEFQISGTPKDLYDINFADLSNGWAVGNDGTIIYTNNGGLLWVPEPANKVKQIKIINYPNPFSTYTTIEYELETASRVFIRIFDSRGQLIKELLQSDQNKGLHKVLWNPDNLPCGIYHYRIQAGNQFGGGKMVFSR